MLFISLSSFEVELWHGETIHLDHLIVDLLFVLLLLFTVHVVLFSFCFSSCFCFFSPSFTTTLLLLLLLLLMLSFVCLFLFLFLFLFCSISRLLIFDMILLSLLAVSFSSPKIGLDDHTKRTTSVLSL